MSATSCSRLDGLEVAFAYGRRGILEGVTLKLGEGEIVALLGANGSGKSTLFRLLLGILKPSSGRVLLNGLALETISRREIARSIAYVPQNHVTPFPYTVCDIVALGRLAESGMFKNTSTTDHDIVRMALTSMGIEHLAARAYTEISGGERQLALIARALAQRAKFIIMDEPMTGLDYGYQLRLQNHIQTLAHKGNAILFSTHNPEHALKIASRVAVLKRGRIVADGPPNRVLTATVLREIYGVNVLTVDDAYGRRFIPNFDHSNAGLR